MAIEMRMEDQDGFVMGEEMTWEDVVGVREAVTKLDRRIEVIRAKFSASASLIAASLQDPVEPGVREFLLHEADGLEGQAFKMGEFREFLAHIKAHFYAEHLRTPKWHRHVQPLYNAFRQVMSITPSKKSWGKSPGGPAVRFIQAALGEILVYEVPDAKEERGFRLVKPKVGYRRIADALYRPSPETG